MGQGGLHEAAALLLSAWVAVARIERTARRGMALFTAAAACTPAALARS
jgi:hypothetical protein